MPARFLARLECAASLAIYLAGTALRRAILRAATGRSDDGVGKRKTEQQKRQAIDCRFLRR